MLPADAELLGRAPGRANLMGEHTDYNDGFVLPVALGMTIIVAGRPTRWHDPAALDRLAQRPWSIRATAAGRRRAGAATSRLWSGFSLEDGIPIRSIEGVIASDLPSGSGLSSSAALEVAVAMAVLEEPIDPIRLARLCQRAENVHVGVRCGIMDQMASVASHAGSGAPPRLPLAGNGPRSCPRRPRAADRGLRPAPVAGDGDYNRRRRRMRGGGATAGVATLAKSSVIDAVEFAAGSAERSGTARRCREHPNAGHGGRATPR